MTLKAITFGLLSGNFEEKTKELWRLETGLTSDFLDQNPNEG